MAVFQSRYRELSFQVGEGSFHFTDGKFTTDDPKVIAVMETMRNVKRLDDPKIEKPKKAEVTEEAPKVEEKAATKRTTTRKASAK